MTKAKRIEKLVDYVESIALRIEHEHGYLENNKEYTLTEKINRCKTYTEKLRMQAMGAIWFESIYTMELDDDTEIMLTKRLRDACEKANCWL